VAPETTAQLKSDLTLQYPVSGFLRIELHVGTGIGYREPVSINREADDQYANVASAPEFREWRLLTQYFACVLIAALDALDPLGDRLS
jgi:hypothetical protein